MFKLRISRRPGATGNVSFEGQTITNRFALIEKAGVNRFALIHMLLKPFVPVGCRGVPPETVRALLVLLREKLYPRGIQHSPKDAKRYA